MDLIHFNRFYRPKYDQCDSQKGIVFTRKMGNIAAYYVRNFHSSKYFETSAIGGILFRQGVETVIYRCWDKAEHLGRPYFLGDLEISAGVRAKLLLPLNLVLSTGIRFTEFVYRHDKSRLEQYVNFAGKGATRHLLDLQFALGYRF